MSKLTRKFVFGLLSILTVVMLLSLYLNLNFIQRYYLHTEKQDVNRICDQLAAAAQGGQGFKALEKTVQEIEASQDVTIVMTEATDDNAALNERLKASFSGKGISLKKYWLWEQDQQDAMENGRKMRLYSQGKLNYSLLVGYLSLDGYFLAVAKTIPSIQATLSLINRVTVMIFAGAGIAMFVLILALVGRIIAPLKKIGETADSIAALDFKTVEIHTHDELETLAGDINRMSLNLKQAHQDLERKNRQMEELLANVSHDLKTPVSLIKAYGNGMQDGMDDGTFLDTILTQNERMERMIQRLLDLARLRQTQRSQEPVDLGRCLQELLAQHRLQADARALAFDCRIEPDQTLPSGREAVELILSNLISNAVKYAARGPIRIELFREEGRVTFRIQNPVSDSHLDIDRLWDPFYVAEQSRNKDMSGTGLGLALVKTAADKYGFLCSCEQIQDQILFTVIF